MKILISLKYRWPEREEKMCKFQGEDCVVISICLYKRIQIQVIKTGFHWFQQRATPYRNSKKQTKIKLLFHIWDGESMVIGLAKVSDFFQLLFIWRNTFKFSMLVLGHKKCHHKTWQKYDWTVIAESHCSLWGFLHSLGIASQDRASGQYTDKKLLSGFTFKFSHSLLKKTQPTNNNDTQKNPLLSIMQN